MCYNFVLSVLFYLMYLVEIYFKYLKDIMNEVGFNRNLLGGWLLWYYFINFINLEGRGVNE